MAVFNLGEIFRDAFGYDAPAEVPEFSITEAAPRLEESSLGQPYYAMDYLTNREYFLPVKINGILIPFAVLGMTWKKTLVETPMPERGGSVIELISIDSYQFNLKGILVNADNNFPEAGIIDLFNLFKINSSVVMRSVLSDIVLSGKIGEGGDDPDGHRVVIKEIKWPPVTGIEHAKPFEMDLISDMILDLEQEASFIGPQNFIQ